MRYELIVQTKDQTDGTVEMDADDILCITRCDGEVIDVVVGPRPAVAYHLLYSGFGLAIGDLVLMTIASKEQIDEYYQGSL